LFVAIYKVTARATSPRTMNQSRVRRGKEESSQSVESYNRPN
jgi:hypothetical protein